MKTARILSLLLWFVAAVGALMQAAEDPTGPVVELPKFVVTDSRILPKPESWRHGTLRDVEVLSNVSDGQTQRILASFERFRQVLAVVSVMPNRDNVPLLLVLTRIGSAFDEQVLGDTTAESVPVSGLFAGPNRGAIVVSVGAGAVPDRELNFRYVKFLLALGDVRLPAWFEEGIMRIVADIEYEDTFIDVGRAERFLVYFQSDDVASEGPPRVFLPFGEFLMLARASNDVAATNTDPASVELETSNIRQNWANQAHAFVHMCLFGEGGKWRKPLAKFLTRTEKEPVSEALFQECFGMGYRKMGTHLRSYIDMTAHELKQYKAKKGRGLQPVPPVALREATQAEIGRIKGQALLLAGANQQARSAMITPYMRGEKDADLLAALGEIEELDGKAERAAKFFDAAVAGKTRDPHAYLAVARSRYTAASVSPAGSDGRFSSEQTAGIVNLLMTANTLHPALLATSELLVDTFARSSVDPTQEQVTLLIRAAVRHPGQLKLVYAAAAFSLQANLAAEARSLIDHGLKYAPDAATRANFEALRRRSEAGSRKAEAGGQKTEARSQRSG